MYNNRFRSKRAFTITELVIVIAVIAILAAILIPTFADVIDNSKKSHDLQLVKSINTALSVNKAETGTNPKDYPELMKVLAQQGLTDASNPFLLATALKQDNAYLIWYPNTNSVTLYVESEDYTLVTTSAIGLGNGVFLQDTAGSEGALGYLLCVNGQHDFIAQLYYDFYIQSGGSINDFNVNFGNSYTNENITANVGDKTWANSIISAIKNQEVGYTHSTVIETEITEQVSTSANAVVNITENLGEQDANKDYADLSSDQKNVVDQAVRATLATLSTLANDKEKAETLAGKTISMTVPEGTEVSFEDVTLTAIGINYRKDTAINNNQGNSTFSTDFGGLTIVDMKVEEGEFISSGAEYQTGVDNGSPEPGYMFTYGLFGTVYAKPGESVTIENLTIKNVDMNLNGSTETIGGKTMQTLTDQAGVVVGFAKGNVTLKNVHVDGVKVDGGRGQFVGYDAVAGLIGRTNGKSGGPITIDNCSVKNLSIEGARRASVFVGVIYNDAQVIVKNSVAENVDFKVVRNDGGEQAFLGVFGDIQGNTAKLTVENVTLTNVTSSYAITVNGAEKTPYGTGYWTMNIGGSKLYLFKVNDAKPYISITNMTVTSGSTTTTVNVEGANVEAGDKTVTGTAAN